MGAQTNAGLAVTKGTHAKRNLAWTRWELFCLESGLGDNLFLLGFRRKQKHYLLGAFVEYIRNRQYSKSRANPIVEGSCRAAIRFVSQTFVNEDEDDPSKDSNGKTAQLLLRQYKSFQLKDKPVEQQQALPLSIIQRLCWEPATDPAVQCAQQLFELAFFWANRSCEYCNVQADRKTKVLTGAQITFRKGKRHSRRRKRSKRKPKDTVTITFHTQKNGDKDDQVTHFATGKRFCPKRVCEDIKQRLTDCGLPQSATIDHYRDRHGVLRRMTSKFLRFLIQNYVAQLNSRYPKNGLNLVPKKIGLHSFRAAAAMAMYLSGVPHYTIMLIGRWKSLCFLSYIRKQVDMFSVDVSRLMLNTPKFSYNKSKTTSRNKSKSSRTPSSKKNKELEVSKRPFRNGDFGVWK